MVKKEEKSIIPKQLLIGNVLGDMLRYKTHLYLTTVELSRFITTISGIILTLTLGKMSTEGFAIANPFIKVGIFMVAGTSLLTICLSLLIIEPQLKKDRDANSFDYGSQFSHLSREEYIDKLKLSLKNSDNIINTYGYELHKLDSIILKRFKMIKSISYLFLFGMVQGGILIILATWWV